MSKWSRPGARCLSTQPGEYFSTKDCDGVPFVAMRRLGSDFGPSSAPVWNPCRNGHARDRGAYLHSPANTFQRRIAMAYLSWRCDDWDRRGWLLGCRKTEFTSSCCLHQRGPG